MTIRYVLSYPACSERIVIRLMAFFGRTKPQS